MDMVKVKKIKRRWKKMYKYVEVEGKIYVINPLTEDIIEIVGFRAPILYHRYVGLFVRHEENMLSEEDCKLAEKIGRKYFEEN